MNSKLFAGHFTLPAIVLGLLLVSCQREPDFDIMEPPQVDPVDSTVLKKVVYLDTTNQAPFDTVFFDGFVYDADGRIEKIYTVDPYSPDIDTISITTYFYHGIDTLPYKSELLDAGDALVLSSAGSSYWEYDDMGRLLKDSTTFISRDNLPTEDLEIASATFAYTPSGVDYHLKHKYYSIPAKPRSGEQNIVGKVQNTIFGNCVVKQVDSVVYEYRTTDNGTLTVDSVYSVDSVNIEYDANPNPFVKIYPARIPVYSLIYYGFDTWEQPHSFTHSNSVNRIYHATGVSRPPLGSESTTSTFRYRGDGYPIIGWINGSYYSEKILFIYDR